MLTEKQHYYLSTMGIDLWVQKNPSSANRERVAHQVIMLRDISEAKIVGKLLLESWNAQDNEEVFKLLDAMLKAIHLQREVSVDATSDPVSFVIIMGEKLSQEFLNSHQNLDALREENVYRREAQPVLVTYHPLQLLQQLNDKRKAWCDLQKLRAMLG